MSPIDGRKVCGCALKFTRNAILLQASIPIGEPLVEPGLLFDQPAPPSKVSAIDSHQFAEALGHAFDNPA